MTLGCIIELFVLWVFNETTQAVRKSNNKLVLVFQTGFEGTTRVVPFNKVAENIIEK